MNTTLRPPRRSQAAPLVTLADPPQPAPKPSPTPKPQREPGNPDRHRAPVLPGKPVEPAPPDPGAPDEDVEPARPSPPALQRDAIADPRWRL